MLNDLQMSAKIIDHMRDLFKSDSDRFEKYSIELDGLLFDYSKNKITDDVLEGLITCAQDCDLEAKRDAMFDGAIINDTEGRAVLHTALRNPPDIDIDGENVASFVKNMHAQMRAISEAIRADKTITDIIHIGLGGSDLGPRLVVEALRAQHSGPRMHFLSNIDGQTVAALTAQLKPENTRVIIASKTFTTLETMENAHVIRDWLGDCADDNIYAITSALDKAAEFNIPQDRILPMRDWIGGRFSVWSTIGLPIAIALGYDAFDAFLKGAARADTHFKTAPLHANIPVIMALLGVLYRNIYDYRAHAVIPYADSLALLSRYMQQLDMESNGKASADHKTGPVIFGAKGTGAQHAFMQSLHQGTDIIPCDFIIAAKNANGLQSFQHKLNANALAQAQALMLGQDNPDEPHRQFDGNRPSNTILLPEITPYSMGMLLALYEHKIFTQGVLWGINSFDQWGVELGKVLAKDIITDLEAGEPSASHDSSTAGLIRVILKA